MTLLSSLSHAWMIGNLPAEKLPLQSCQLVMRSAPQAREDGSKYIELSQCSGTIIGTSKLLTAAHCFAGKTFASGSVICPGDSSHAVTKWTFSKSYVATRNKKEVGKMGPLDLAVVEIQDEFKAKPAHFPKDTDEVLKRLNDFEDKFDPSCGLFGYGLDENDKTGNHAGRSIEFRKQLVSTTTRTRKNRTTGEVISTEVVKNYDWFREGEMLYVPSSTEFKDERANGVRGGDSGGGLLCQTDTDSPVLLAVTSGSTSMTHKEGESAAGFLVSTAHRAELIEDLLLEKSKTTQTFRPESSEATPHKPTSDRPTHSP